jgi:hypothetical protein
LTAGVVQPSNTCTISLLQTNNARSASRNETHPFMAGYKRQRRFHRPIAVGGMKIGVTDPTSGHLDQNLARAWRRNRYFLDA